MFNIDQISRDKSDHVIEAKFLYYIHELASLTPAEVWILFQKEFGEGMEQLYRCAMRETGRQP